MVIEEEIKEVDHHIGEIKIKEVLKGEKIGQTPRIQEVLHQVEALQEISVVHHQTLQDLEVETSQ